MDSQEINDYVKMWKITGNEFYFNKIVLATNDIVKYFANIRTRDCYGREREDTVAELREWIVPIINTYDEKRGGFLQYFSTACGYKVTDILRRHYNNMETSYDLYNIDDDSMFEDRIATEETGFLIERLQSEFMSHLTKLEADMMAMYQQGYSYEEIAKELETTPKSVDNALTRSRIKLKKYLRDIIG